MPNVIFLASELEGYSFAASEGSAAGGPTTNLNSYIQTEKWISLTSTGSQYLYMDRGSDTRSIDGIGLVNHNFYGIMASGGIAIQADDNSSFTSPTNLIASLAIPSTSPITVKFPLGSTSERYIRILFNGNLNWAPSVGNVFFDKILDFGYPYDYPYSPRIREYETNVKVMINGLIRTSNTLPGRRTFRFGISANRGGFTDAIATEWQTLYSRIQGRLRPFFFLDVDGSSAYYVHFDSDDDPLTVLRYNINGIAEFKLMEQVSS